MTAADDWFRPTPLELATTTPIGGRRDPWSRPERTLTPFEALEALLRPALQDPPCLLGFSGGRDSSGLMAVAMNLARREGLEPPIAITLRHPYSDKATENEWQELVIKHLGVTEWVKREVAEGESDLFGPWGTAGLKRHGVVYPPNAFSMDLMLDGTTARNIVVGQGGDLMFLGWHWQRVADIVARRQRPERRDLLRLGFAAAPRPLRMRSLRRHNWTLHWLRPAALEAWRAAMYGEEATAPMRWSAWTWWAAQRRSQAMTLWSLRRFAADHGVTVHAPFVDRTFVHALGRLRPVTGPGDRTAIMRAIFGGYLPEASITRQSKASFENVFWTQHARAFAAEWDGTGVDPDLVDPEALKRELTNPDPLAATYLQAQQLWLLRERG